MNTITVILGLYLLRQKVSVSSVLLILSRVGPKICWNKLGIEKICIVDASIEDKY